MIMRRKLKKAFRAQFTPAVSPPKGTRRSLLCKQSPGNASDWRRLRCLVQKLSRTNRFLYSDLFQQNLFVHDTPPGYNFNQTRNVQGLCYTKRVLQKGVHALYMACNLTLLCYYYHYNNHDYYLHYYCSVVFWPCAFDSLLI